MRVFILSTMILWLLSGICTAAEPPNAYVTRIINAPVSIAIDGDLSDWEGIEVPEEPLRNRCISAGEKGQKFVLLSGDADLSASLRCFVHEDIFYIAVSVTDDLLVFGEEQFGSRWQDDSVEIYFDGDLAVRQWEYGSDHSETPHTSNYDRNDAEIRIAKDRQGMVHLEGMGLFGDRLMMLPGLWESLGIVAAIRENARGYTAELKVPKGVFVSTPLRFGAEIGFNVMINDDDDGEERDHKISWTSDPSDKSWHNTAMFGTLVIQHQEQP
ncbi:MAG: hypothetical protein KAJ05_01045 [Candidatus Latescibacteria bacterium]|nr:hypothetical protein [Candidatus Latescibacterota bacterium]